MVPLVPLVHVVHSGPWSKEEKEEVQRRERSNWGPMVSRCQMGTFTVITMNNTFIPCTTPMVELYSHKIDNTDKRVGSVGIRIQDGLSRIDGAEFQKLSESDQIKLVNKTVKVAIKGNNAYLSHLKKAV